MPTPRAKAPPDGVRRDLWPVREAAYLLGVSTRTLYRERDRGRIAVVQVGTRYYVRDSEVRRYLDDVDDAAGAAS